MCWKARRLQRWQSGLRCGASRRSAPSSAAALHRAAPASRRLLPRCLAAQVLIVDPNPLAPWVNNFGVWIDEFELMGLADCLDYTWDRALVYLNSESDGAR